MGSKNYEQERRDFTFDIEKMISKDGAKENDKKSWKRGGGEMV